MAHGVEGSGGQEAPIRDKNDAGLSSSLMMFLMIPDELHLMMPETDVPHLFFVIEIGVLYRSFFSSLRYVDVQWFPPSIASTFQLWWTVSSADVLKD
jgi:hypothetical protein